MALCWRYLCFAAGHETNSKSTRRWTFEPERFSTWIPVAAAVVAVPGHPAERCFLSFHSEVECWFAVHFYHTLPRHFVCVRSPWWKEEDEQNGKGNHALSHEGQVTQSHFRGIHAGKPDKPVGEASRKGSRRGSIGGNFVIPIEKCQIRSRARFQTNWASWRNPSFYTEKCVSHFTWRSSSHHCVCVTRLGRG